MPVELRKIPMSLSYCHPNETANADASCIHTHTIQWMTMTTEHRQRSKKRKNDEDVILFRTTRGVDTTNDDDHEKDKLKKNIFCI